MGIAGRDVDNAGQISIRSAAATDAEAVGQLLVAVAGPLAAPIWGGGDLESARVRFAGLFRSWGGFRNHYVACDGSAVIGLIAHMPDRTQTGQSFRVSLAMLQVFGLLGALTLGWRMRHLVSAKPGFIRNSYSVWNLAVAGGYRRRGVGNALLRHAHGAARNAGASTVGLEVLIDNSPAIQFYTQAGYKEQRRRASAGLRRLSGSPGLIYMVRAVKPED